MLLIVNGLGDSEPSRASILSYFIVKEGGKGEIGKILRYTLTQIFLPKYLGSNDHRCKRHL